MTRKAALLVGFLALFGGSKASAIPIQWTAASEGNGHWYEFVGYGVGGMPEPIGTWENARAAAEARGGYLATPTSAAEWAFMQSNMSNWVGPVDPVYTGPLAGGSFQGWLGGFQNTSSPSYSEPGGGWEWVTGEPWGFTAWSGGEPNNNGSENHLLTWFHDASGWNDHVNGAGRFFVEYDTNPIPEPTTATLMALGLLGLSMRRGSA